jgi:hypothetical protein
MLNSDSMRHRIVARHPRWAAVVVLMISLFANYLCFDLRYVHAIEFANGITAESPWFWPVFGAFIALMLHSVKQLAFPSVLMVANVFGLELRHRVLKPAVRVPWENVHEVSRVQKLVATKGKQAVTQDGIRFEVSAAQDLKGVTSASVQVEPGGIFFNGYLFDRELDDIVANLRELRHNAVGQRAKS